MAAQHLRVHLEVALEVDHAILKDNNEPLSDEEVACLLSVSVAEGSFLSCVDEAVEVVATRVVEVQRRTGRSSGKAARREKKS